MSKKSKDKFVFWMPCDIEKAENADSGEVEMKMKGIASTTERDSDGEVLEPEGFELDFFLTSGLVNWHHQTKDKPMANIGEPTLAKIVPEGLYVETLLYPDSQLAREVYGLAELLQKNSKTRRLGFSIEGKVLERDALDETRILKARLTGLAITHIPKNPATICEIMKGERDGFDMEWDEEITKGEGIDIDAEEEEEDEAEKSLNTTSGAALTTESLEGSPDRGKTKEGVLSKGEVFSKIFSDFPDISLPNSKRVYRVIEKISENMNGKNNQITNDVISKAYEALGISDDENIEKGDTTATQLAGRPENGGKVTYYRELEKGEYQKMYKGESEDGSDDEPADDKTYVQKGDEFVEKGEDADDTADEQGEVEKGEQDDLNKGQNNNIGNQDASTELIKGIVNELQKGNVEMFKAVGTVLKSISDTQNQIMERLESEARVPEIGRKSIQSANQLERFSKGQGDDLNGGAGNSLSLSGQRNQVLKVLNDATFAKGGFNEFYANALTTYEASGQMPADVRSSILSDRKIQIID